MLALYRSGRQAEALDVYRRGRRRLRDELGLEPGEELRRLEQAILAHDRTIAGPPRPARPLDADAEPGGGRVALALGAVVLAAGTAGVLLSRSPHHRADAAAVPAHTLALVAPGTGRIGRIRLGWTRAASRSPRTRSGC